MTKKWVSYFTYLNRLIWDIVRLPARKYPIVDVFFPNPTLQMLEKNGLKPGWNGYFSKV